MAHACRPANADGTRLRERYGPDNGLPRIASLGRFARTHPFACRTYTAYTIMDTQCGYKNPCQSQRLQAQTPAARPSICAPVGARRLSWTVQPMPWGGTAPTSCWTLPAARRTTNPASFRDRRYSRHTCSRDLGASERVLRGAGLRCIAPRSPDAENCGHGSREGVGREIEIRLAPYPINNPPFTLSTCPVM